MTLHFADLHVAVRYASSNSTPPNRPSPHCAVETCLRLQVCKKQRHTKSAENKLLIACIPLKLPPRRRVKIASGSRRASLPPRHDTTPTHQVRRVRLRAHRAARRAYLRHACLRHACLRHACLRDACHTSIVSSHVVSARVKRAAPLVPRRHNLRLVLHTRQLRQRPLSTALPRLVLLHVRPH